MGDFQRITIAGNDYLVDDNSVVVDRDELGRIADERSAAVAELADLKGTAYRGEVTLHEVAAKLYKDPAGAVLALRQITAILEVAKATYAALFKNSTHFTSEQHARHAILTIEQQQAEIADTLELLATGEEPDVRRENEKAAARKAKKAVIEEYSVVRRGVVRKTDKLYAAKGELAALIDVPAELVGLDVQIVAEEIYRKR